MYLLTSYGCELVFLRTLPMMENQATTGVARVTIRFRANGGKIPFAEAVFNSTAISHFDACLPERTHIDVYFDKDTNEIGFQLMYRANKEPIHERIVAVTKAMRALGIVHSQFSVDLRKDVKLNMYIAKLEV